MNSFFKTLTRYDSVPEAYKKYIILFWKTFFYGFGFVLLLFFLAGIGAFGSLPKFRNLENPVNNLATQIISSDGVNIGTFAVENRVPLHYNDLPKNLVQALVATEDERFYEHSGIDFRRTVGAVLKLGQDGGASTITQQLAKNLFTKKASQNLVFRIIQKIKEIIIAVRLERRYSKNEIITMYLNQYDFINQAVGIRSAARIYFGKEPIDLKVEESAMLVGMLKNSALYNPLKEKRVKMVKERRNTVLAQMLRNKIISKHLKDSLSQKDLGLDVHRENHREGLAPYFREYLRLYLQDYFKKHPKADGSIYDIYADGLKIYISIDSRMQKYAEEAVAAHMANLQRVFFNDQKHNKTAPFIDLTKQEIESSINRAMRASERWRKMKAAGKSDSEIIKSFSEKAEMTVFTWKGEKDTIMTPRDSIFYYKHFLRAGMIAMEPQTGLVKAWVGGTDFKHFMYDAVTQKRQVGSTFKPFVYATAVNQMKVSPNDVFSNARFTIPRGKYDLPEDWTPDNADNHYGGSYTLKKALANSVNVVTARLIDEVTPTTVAELANRAGIKSEIPHVPSIALGSVDLTLFEMVSAYSSFVNKGQHIDPTVVLRVEDKNGIVIYENVPATNEVFSEDSAYVLLEMLKGVTEEGSGQRLRNAGSANPDGILTGFPYLFENPIAGKTGTTQNQSDGWFIGMVPNLAAGVWVGGEDRATHFYGIAKGQGASMALPIWALFMKKCYKDSKLKVSREDFEKPENFDMSKFGVSAAPMTQSDPYYPDTEDVEF